jgi:hypothetical protein
LYLGAIGGGCSLESYGYFHKKEPFLAIERDVTPHLNAEM